MVNAMKYVQQFRTVSGWETVTDDNEKPVMFESSEVAWRDLWDHNAAALEAVSRGNMDDYDVNDWQVATVFEYESFGDALEFAESLGWIDENIEPWDENAADATEASALDHIKSRGYVVVDLEA